MSACSAPVKKSAMVNVAPVTRSPFVRGNSAAPKIVSQLAGVWRDDENPLYAFPIAQ